MRNSLGVGSSRFSAIRSSGGLSAFANQRCSGIIANPLFNAMGVLLCKHFMTSQLVPPIRRA
jgi:hypothetical protein